MKKIACLLFLLFFLGTNVSFSSESKNFYVGIKGGASKFLSNKFFRFYEDIPPTISQSNYKKSTGVFGGIFAGYTFNLSDRFSISPEISATLGGEKGAWFLNVSTAGPTVLAKVILKKKFSFGAGGLFSYGITNNFNILGYVGFEMARFQGILADAIRDSSGNTVGDTRGNDYRHGGSLGFGFERKFETFSLRLMAKYVRYDKEKAYDDGTLVASSQPHDGNISLGIKIPL